MITVVVKNDDEAAMCHPEKQLDTPTAQNNRIDRRISLIRRDFLKLIPWLLLSPSALAASDPLRHQPPAIKLINAAREQLGVTLLYDPAYVRLAYPEGDPSPDKGVCTDVIIRAYRRAFGYDLQYMVHEDMRRHFGAYPKIWGLKRPDTNIDHRRVPNLQTFLKRKNAELKVSKNPLDYKPGDLVTQLIGNKLPHIVIVSDRKSQDDSRNLVIHNIGGGTQEEDYLFGSPITGHYRFFP